MDLQQDVLSPTYQEWTLDMVIIVKEFIVNNRSVELSGIVSDNTTLR